MAAVLFVRRGALGDTLLVIPALRALRAWRPGTALHFAGNLDFAVLLERYGVVDRALSSEDVYAWPRDRLAGYDQVVTDGELPRAVASRVVSVDPRVPDDANAGAAAVLLARLRAALPGVPPADPVPALRTARAAPATPPQVVLHAGSGGRRKCWPESRWEGLARALHGRGLRVLSARGPAEHERDVACLPGCEPLDEPDVCAFATRIEPASVFVGNDAGPTHLAAALHVPTVAIFGPSERRVWAPPAAHVRVVGRRTAGPPDASVQEALAAVVELLARA